jgi:hypothetical protein
MFQSKRTAIALLASGLMVVGLAACAGSGSGDAPTATTTVTSTATTTATASASPSDDSSGNTGGGGDTGGGSTSGLCASTDLSGGTEAGSGGAAGSVIIHLTFTNTSSSSCTLQGWPGVSFVGNDNGTQIGAAAVLDRSSVHPTVTLAPGAVAVAPLKIAQAGNYGSADCGPTPANGFRVYPPGSKTSLFIPDTSFTACSVASVQLLSVQGIVAEGQATD